MCPSHLFCRLLTVSIISLSVSTICSISSFVLCSVYSTFIIRLSIHISNAWSRWMSSFRKVRPCFASIQRNTPNKCSHHTFLQVKADRSSHEVSLLVESLFFSKSKSPSYFMTTSTNVFTTDVHWRQLCLLTASSHVWCYYFYSRFPAVSSSCNLLLLVCVSFTIIGQPWNSVLIRRV